ncbi:MULTISPECIES: phosphatidate cytidylyltransferase [Metallosphaera]|uniref:phosphatidate cytidylyltransferase n=1 Tax=Metallosphaera TaxID=41980 RepID=UPI001F0699CE|nr:phosphatidate cytidylyltransferase [Metallosphaera sedula]MCH1772061.1 phosphatidate cytidylyltransferase [Metallosphaera sedula]MCP6729873.1 phosphatidate cytidylyltransferase [Metallosphaera sedula]
MLLTFKDAIIGIIYVVWVALVTLKLSKIVAKKTNTYVARKFIHMAGGGVVAVTSPFLLSSPLVVIVASYLMMGYLLIRRLRQPMSWFQESDNMGEIFFSFSFGTILLVMWILEPTFWELGNKYLYVALLPLIFMSFGDGVTGIVRNYVYGRRFKGFWGSVGMLILTAPLGYLLLSVPGLLSAVIATAVEVLPILDDNLSVSFLSFAFLLAAVKLG